MKEIGAVILAAGFSSRLGAFKPLLHLAGRTLLERVVLLFRQEGAREILVVCGHRGEEVAAAARALDARPVINPEFSKGMFSSVKAGLAEIKKAEAAWMLPVDIPLIRPATLRLMQKTWNRRRTALVHPTFGGEVGHPPLLDRAIWAHILQHNGDQGLRGALAPWHDEAVEVACGDRNILLDLDTPHNRAEMEYRAARLGVPDHQESDELAREVLALAPDLLNHGRLVASTALALGGAIGNDGLDRDLLYAAGLLHDLDKGRPGHQETGAERLRELGLAPVADVMISHGDMPPPASGRLGEAELLCLADKCVQGARLVQPSERYRAKLELFGFDPEACKAIKRKWKNCRRMQSLWEQKSGISLEAFLAWKANNA